MAAQGVLLFGLAFFELKEGGIIQLLFILLETLIFKALFVPLFLQRITKNKIHRHHSGPVKGILFRIVSTTHYCLSVFLLGIGCMMS